MFRLSIALATLWIALVISWSATAESRPNAAAPTREIVLFGASWCAPCIAELRDLRQIAATASPDRIVIVWEDGGLARFPLQPLANVEVAAPPRASRLNADLAARRTGLPYAAILTASGKRCAEHRGRVTPDIVTAMKQACEAVSGG